MGTNQEGGRVNSEDRIQELSERIQVLEALLDAVIWGPYLHNPDHRHAIAEALNARLLEGNLQEPACPPNVRRELFALADGLAGIDSQPDPLKPVLRPFVRSALRDNPRP